jgi:Putative Ig domain
MDLDLKSLTTISIPYPSPQLGPLSLNCSLERSREDNNLLKICTKSASKERFLLRQSLRALFLPIFLFLSFANQLLALNIAVNLVSPSDAGGENIKNADGTLLPSNALFKIGTFVQDPDTNAAAIAALLSPGNVLTNLNNTSNFLTFGTAIRSNFAGGILNFDYSLSANLEGKSIFLIAYNNNDPTLATQVGVYRFYDGAANSAKFDSTAGADTQLFPTLLPESDPTEDVFATPFFGNLSSGNTFLSLVAGGLAITSANPTDAVKGQPYSYTITANNGATSYSATGLPAGLMVNTATGVISGTPTSAGTSTVTLRANNPLFVEVTKVVTFTVNAPAGLPPVITPIGAQTAYRGVPFSLTVSASNDPTGFTLSGAPAGFSISAGGVITGTTPASAGISILSIQASNAGGTSDPQLVTLTLANPTVTPSQSSVNGAVGSAITPTTFTVVPTGSNPSFGGSSLPAGLTLNSANGNITGTPTSAATSTRTFTATFASGVTAQADIVFNISGPLPVLLAPAPAELEATRAQEFSLILQRALNGAVGPFTYEQVSGVNLSTIGLSLQTQASGNTTAGLISGTPTKLGVYSASFRVYNSSGASNILPITITVDAAQPVINCELNRAAGVGLPFRHVFSSNDSEQDKTVTGLPPGLTFQRNVSFNNGFFDMISGIPSSSGPFPLTLGASTQKRDGSTLSTSSTLTIQVDGSRPDVSSLGIRPGTFRLNEPTRTTYAPAEGFFLTGSDMGASSTIYMNATGLPPGLGFGKTWNGTAYEDGTTTQKTLARRRGLITGTPTQAGIYSITLYVQNGLGYTKSALVLTVLP